MAEPEKIVEVSVVEKAVATSPKPTQPTILKRVGGCLGGVFGLLFFCFFIYTLLDTNHAELWYILIHTGLHLYFRLSLSILAFILLSVFLYYLSGIEERVKKDRGVFFVIYSNLESVPILGELVRIAPIIVNPIIVYKKALRRRSLVFGSLIFSIITINLQTPVLSLLNLPPAKPTAADVVYQIDFNEADKASIVAPTPILEYLIPSNHFLNIDPANESPLLGATIKVLRDRLGNKPQKEWASEFSLNGISLLELVLEAKWNVRSASDLKEPLKNAPDLVRADYEAVMKEENNASEWTDFRENLVYIPFIFVAGGLFYSLMKKNRRSYSKALAITAYMVTGCTLFHVIYFAALAQFNYLFVASAFMLVANFVYMQMWLLFVVPEVLKISPGYTFLWGNLGYIVFQIGSFLLLNSYYHLF
jgi:hypothetical protein